jgi:predicted ribosomally synthesized peptide with SipW-like signal peptide
VGGAFAYFSDTEESTGNTFTAGTLDIELGTASYSAGIDNMAPGDTVTVTIDVTSVGSLPLDYTVSASITGAIMLGENGGADDPDVSEIRIDSVSTSSDSLSASTGGDASDTIEIDITLPTTAGNNYQGLGGSLDITVDADQQ